MNTFQQIFALLATGAFFLLVYLLQPILMPFLVGFVLAYLGDPLVDRFENWKINRTLGVAIVFVLFFSMLVAALLILIPMLTREVNALVRQVPAFIEWLQKTASPFFIEQFNVDPFDFSIESIREQLTGNWQQAGNIATRVFAEVTSSGFAMVGWLMNLVLIPVVAFYLMRDWDEIMVRLRELLPREMEATTVKLAKDCDEVLSAFLRGQLLIMLLLGVIYAIGLYIVGLDLALLIGMLAGLASIVPYLGFVVGILAATLAALFQFQDVIHLVYVLVVFGIGQMLEGMVLTPLLVGDRIGLHPVAVIFALLAGGQLFGFVGILLALPVAAVIMVFARYAHDRYKESHYYNRAS